MSRHFKGQPSNPVFTEPQYGHSGNSAVMIRSKPQYGAQDSVSVSQASKSAYGRQEYDNQSQSQYSRNSNSVAGKSQGGRSSISRNHNLNLEAEPRYQQKSETSSEHSLAHSIRSNNSQKSRQSNRNHETHLNPNDGLRHKARKNSAHSQYSNMTSSTLNRVHRVKELEVEVKDLAEYNMRELLMLQRQLEAQEKSATRDQLLKAINDKRSKEKEQRMLDNLEDAGETNSQYAQRLNQLREFEASKKNRFRDDLKNQAEGDRERRARQKAEENYVELIDDSELIKAQIEREAIQKQQYRADLKHAIDAKEQNVKREKQSKEEEAELLKLLDQENAVRLRQIQEAEALRKKYFQADLERQLELKKARANSDRQDDINWSKKQEEIYKKMVEEERQRDLGFKRAFREELDREIVAKAQKKANQRLEKIRELEQLRHRDQEQQNLLEHLKEVEQSKKAYFRDVLKKQAELDREKKARQTAEEKAFNIPDDSSLIAAQLEREKILKRNYLSDLDRAVQEKQGRKSKEFNSKIEEQEHNKALELLNHERLSALYELELNKKKHFQNDLKTQIQDNQDRKRRRAEEEDDSEWRKQEQDAYEKLLREQQGRQLAHKQNYRQEQVKIVLALKIRLNDAVEAKRSKEEAARQQEIQSLIELKQRDGQQQARLEYLQQVEADKKAFFRDQLKQQAEFDREKKRRQHEEDNRVEYIDDSELIAEQIRREKLNKQNYREDLKSAIDQKLQKKTVEHQKELEDLAHIQLAAEEHRERLIQMQQLEENRKRQFQADLSRQLELKKAKDQSQKNQDIVWVAEQQRIYEKMVAEERQRDYDFKMRFRKELSDAIEQKNSKNAQKKLEDQESYQRLLENQSLHRQRLAQLAELEENKKQRFRTDLIHQIETQKEKRSRQIADEKNFEFPDDSELVAYQIQREQQEKQAYKDDLKHQIENKARKQQEEQSRKQRELATIKQTEEQNRLNQMIIQQQLLQAKKNELQKCLELSKKNESLSRKKELDKRLQELEYLREIEIEFKHEIENFKKVALNMGDTRQKVGAFNQLKVNREVLDAQKINFSKPKPSKIDGYQAQKQSHKQTSKPVPVEQSFKKRADPVAI